MGVVQSSFIPYDTMGVGHLYGGRFVALCSLRWGDSCTVGSCIGSRQKFSVSSVTEWCYNQAKTSLIWLVLTWDETLYDDHEVPSVTSRLEVDFRRCNIFSHHQMSYGIDIMACLWSGSGSIEELTTRVSDISELNDTAALLQSQLQKWKKLSREDISLDGSLAR